MTKLGPEFRGKLPPGGAEQLKRSLKSYREAWKLGALAGVQILPPGPPWLCPVANAQAEAVYPIDAVPRLPFKGCERAPCCACCYGPVVKGD